MKYKYIVFFFFSFALTAQNLAKVNYIVLPQGGSLEKNEVVVKSKLRVDGIDEELKKLEYELLIKNNKSFFYLISALDINERITRIAKMFAGKYDYYRDNDKKTVLKVIDFSGETFNMLSEVDNNWQLTNETKTINGYLCYKALIQKKVPMKKTNNRIEVIAWYCPTIPLSYGPKEFGGLPGLILELHDDKIVYLVSKIDINSNLDIKINEVKGKIITEENFDKIVEQTHQNNMNAMPK
ncbi:GLPGLI family protein [Flavobacterium sp. 2]|uniref:GLPGLI family protein n=1 Tax=Flavobacterium sp. 2 TaxID=308053 RepID=UPI000C19416C|nr:GLPGLI family protein [Flavobacterium sp. 2]PIF59977.1 GLPGLI family protein [Flavobacterium sp. 2]